MGESVLTAGRREDGKTGGPAAAQVALFQDAGLTRREDGVLQLGGVSLEEIAREVGTPAYLYNAEVIRARVAELNEAFASLEHRIYYAVKANSCLAVLKLLRELGTGCDIVSVGELRRALAAGFAPERLVFSGVGKRTDELAQACAVGIGQINLESLEELEALGALARATSGPRVRVAIRVNPDVTVETHPYTRTAMAAAKFGVPADQVLEAARRVAANDRLELRGLAMHVGSQVLDPAPFVSGACRLAELARTLRGEGIPVGSLDLGGGLGIRYLDETPLTPRRLAEALVPIVAPLGLTIHLEPGRYLVGSAGILVATVLYRKHAGGTDFVVVDTGMNDLERPSRYQAHHEIVVVQDRGREARPVDVVGPICESGDFLALARPLPEVEPGDLLAVLGAGAYGFVMSSNYNDRPRPPEIMVDGGVWQTVRRRETLEDLLRLENN
jgi:diaminopimelate decarboxylase